MKVVYFTEGGMWRLARGPADLLAVGAGGHVVLMGAPVDGDHASWSSAIGQAAMRGASVNPKEAE